MRRILGCQHNGLDFTTFHKKRQTFAWKIHGSTDTHPVRIPEISCQLTGNNFYDEHHQYYTLNRNARQDTTGSRLISRIIAMFI
jgi:hypothetical protein